MATTKKFDIENPTDEMIENLTATAPGEDGFHVTKLSARDSARFIEMSENPPEPSEETKVRWRKMREDSARLILGRRS